METDKYTIKLEGRDYKVTDNHYILYNVPIAAELVQKYDSGISKGMAFKPNKEIQKIKVDNVPLTVVGDNPDHPPGFLTGNTTDYKAEYTVGYMSEPSKLKDNAHPKKRYADFILEKNRVTDMIFNKYKNGEYIDTSIGFRYKRENKKGVHEGVEYDYIQKDILLDHNAILIDNYGNRGVGRMPSPIGGIGADKDETGDNMSDANAKLEAQIDSLNKELAEANKTIAEYKDNDAQKQLDSLKSELDSIKESKEKVDEQLKQAVDKLEVYVAAEKEQLEKMKDSVVKHYGEDFKELFENASDDLIKSYHAKMQEQKNSKPRNIGADMFGSGKNQKEMSKNQQTADWINGLKKSKE